jgi:hypothetical protein
VVKRQKQVDTCTNAALLHDKGYFPDLVLPARVGHCQCAPQDMIAAIVHGGCLLYLGQKGAAAARQAAAAATALLGSCPAGRHSAHTRECCGPALLGLQWSGPGSLAHVFFCACQSVDAHSRSNHSLMPATSMQSAPSRICS